ncbi:hypothetical protein BU25DRAFT_407355 [Macroventuria anomochaeta]|uniref:Uncharacterized protein n=1 Tax=Macroventuria anomochaeta TaxID=301207 RepID=A0ACB6SBR4_9PLEO|nr:uncharacterized protein BU25DRAFT_407355 [Macroventuria anomochaeta]KAF2631715.1 hypothetical protein BU25DRAFT_407355 [Macroventuria anomochaeta]
MSTQITKKLKLLITGLNVHADIPTSFRELFGTPDEIQAAITADENRIRDVGFDVTSYQIDDTKAEAGLKWVESKLCSEHFDGVMIGSGLRLIPTQTVLFESVVDVCRRIKPDAVFMFNGGPGTNWETLQRNLRRLQ